MPSERIAIVGLALRAPGASTLDEFWDHLWAGDETIAPTRTTNGNAGDRSRRVPVIGRIDGIDLFDPEAFEMTPAEASVTDPQHRILLECAREALHQCGHNRRRSASAAVYVGQGWNSFFIDEVKTRPWLAGTYGARLVNTANRYDNAALRLSYKFNLTGPSFVVLSNCSTGLLAVHLAVRALRTEPWAFAVAGAVTVQPSIDGYDYQPNGVLSPDGHCAPFDRRGSGTVPSSGAAVVVLKRLQDAIADRDHVWALIAGSAANNDGYSKLGYSAPSIAGQSAAVRAALADAGLSADAIDYVESHGTGTELGDPVEFAALTEAFRATTDRQRFCQLGSLKANIGHTDTAAGILGLAKVVLMLNHDGIPALINLRHINPKLAVDKSPFVLAAQRQRWPRRLGRPRRAGITSLGIGGTNVHVVLEETPAGTPQSGEDGERPEYLLVQARTPALLQGRAAMLAGWLARHEAGSLSDVAFTLRQEGLSLPIRQALRVTSRVHAIEALVALASNVPPTVGAAPSGYWMLLSGQGQGYPAMGCTLYQRNVVFRRAIEECDRALGHPSPGPLARVLARHNASTQVRGDEPSDQLRLFALEYGLASVIRAAAGPPHGLIGHSLGEYVAGAISGVIPLGDALRMIAERSQWIEQTVPGRMASVWCSEAALAPVALQHGVEIAAINGPLLCTISGSGPAVDAAMGALAARGIRSQLLKVQRAFHSRAMDEAAEAVGNYLRNVTLQPPSVQIVSCLTGAILDDEAATSWEHWARVTRAPVRFAQALAAISSHKPTIGFEIGPGAALTALVQTSRPDIRAWPTCREGRELDSLQQALSEAWSQALDVDWSALDEDPHARRLALPPPPLSRRRCWPDREREAPRVVHAAAMPEPETDVGSNDGLQEAITECHSQVAVLASQLQALEERLQLSTSTTTPAAPACEAAVESPALPGRSWPFDISGSTTAGAFSSGAVTHTTEDRRGDTRSFVTVPRSNVRI